MSLVAASAKDIARMSSSIKWTEDYRERINQILDQSPLAQSVAKLAPPVRAILLQDCFEGKDAMALVVGRDNVTYGFYVELIGQNFIPTTNKFKLKILGQPPTPANNLTPEPVELGTTGLIKASATADDMWQALSLIDTRLNRDNLVVMIGNPFSHDDLFANGGAVVEPQTTNEPFTERNFPTGVWFIYIETPAFREFVDMSIEIVVDEESHIGGLTNITIKKSFDLPSPEMTPVKDIDCRSEDFPWQAGTIVTCLDFADVGYGIIRSTARNMQVSTPLN